MKEKFENIMRDRLQFEEHAYDPKGWEAFQNEYGTKPKPSRIIKLTKTSILLLFVLCTITLSAWYASRVFKKDEVKISSKLSENKNVDNQITKAFPTDNINNIENSKNNLSLEKAEKNEVILSSKSQVIRLNREELFDEYSTAQKQDESKAPFVKSKKTINDESDSRMIFNKSNSELLSINDRKSSFNSKGKLNRETGFTSETKGINKNVLDTPDNSNGLNKRFNYEAENKINAIGQTLQSDNLNKSNSQSSIEQKFGNFDILEEGKGIVSTTALVDGLDLLPRKTTIMNKQQSTVHYNGEFVRVLGKPKTNFYLGAGYVSTFKQRSVENKIRPFDPSIYKIGLDYNLTYNTSLTFELNINYQQYLDISRVFNFYNQTATNFWFFEIEARHRSHVHIELPILFNYHLLNDAVRVYGGASLAYVKGKVNANLNTNLTYNQIDEFGLPTDYNKFINPINGSLILGVRLPILKWLHIDARFNKGLLDISDDGFWESGVNTNDYFTISTLLNF